MRRLAALSVIPWIVLALSSAAEAERPSASGPPGDYIVTLADGADPTAVAADHARTLGASVHHVYGAALNGYAASLPAPAVSRLLADPRVASVEPDGVVTVLHHRNGHTGGPGGGGEEPPPPPPPESCDGSTQEMPWGIDKVDADVSSTIAGDCQGAVGGVRVYVIDTGIAAHSDLNRAGQVDLVGDGFGSTDCHGHGTHVAGTAAARDNLGHVVGVAPGAPVYGVRVLNCAGSGTWSGVIAGIDWVTANAQKPAVANMSLGGPYNAAVNAAVQNSVASGVFYAVAAGNESTDACTRSPASAGPTAGVSTVGATDSGDKVASFSNGGSCVDIYAPGVSVVSTSASGGTTTKSGTSMASPHVAGAAALYLASHPSASPVAVEAAINDAAATPAAKGKGRQGGNSTITRLDVSTF